MSGKEVTQPAVEAARIAAETAYHNTVIAAVVTVSAALIALAGTVVMIINSNKISKQTSSISKELGQKNLQSLDKRRLIDTVSTQRIEWINNIRHHFSNFNQKAFLLLQWKINNKIQQQKDTPSANSKLEKENLFNELVEASSQIELFLNPTEKMSLKLLKTQSEVMKLNLDDRYSLDEYVTYMHYSVFFQQVILKAEWKRLKQETEFGRLLYESEINKIFEETAKKIDKEKYTNMNLFL